MRYLTILESVHFAGIHRHSKLEKRHSPEVKKGEEKENFAIKILDTYSLSILAKVIKLTIHLRFLVLRA